MPSTPNFSELGTSGLNRYGGIVTEEFLRELSGLRWQKNVREMTSNDPVINAGFFAIEMLTRQVTWDIQAGSESREDEEIAQFIREALFEDMSQPWSETIAEIHSYLPWGWSWHEIVYKRRSGPNRDPSKNSKFNDGRIGWRKWPIRSQESLDRWQFDEAGGIQAMVQLAPPDYREVIIPIERSLLFRTTAHKNNPEGRSLCRAIFRPWYFKKQIENYEGIGIERDLAGLVVITLPAEYMDPNATSEKVAVYNYAKEMATSIKNNEQAGVVFPSDCFEGTSNKMFEVSLLSSGGQRLFDTSKIIQRKNQEILLTLMADFLLLGHEKVGSFALSSDKTSLFTTAIGSFLDSDCEVINRHAIPRLLEINGIVTENPPKLTHGDIETVDLMVLGEFISKLAGAGVSLNPELLAYVLEQGGLPVPDDPAEMDKMLEPKMPTVDPTKDDGQQNED